MMGKKEIRDLEDMMGSTALLLPGADGEDQHHFHDEGYPYLQELYRRAKGDVARLGMTETVEHAIKECMVLVKQGDRKAAQHLLLSACRELSEKSGAFAEMRKMYEAPTRH